MKQKLSPSADVGNLRDMILYNCKGSGEVLRVINDKGISKKSEVPN